ncbi:hypothetical protein [Vibrio vulnificus]|uniref:hypothetical protein n=1 Tax=Vibrio vulnificus TaxID=672 RepID=UPI0005C4EB1D|nr:hypothetical protein [Vibrio vulnificus]EGR7945070.1 hypothetical protein [Vibrio vulnificus]EHU9442533.1 hypothetical protein [Vibrio vulnificus]EID4338896.1 hypothetical protein [Vibrio vulnificus]ELH7532731.1 hypothetical protein [Vibrio vulnificus]MCU8212429.1 hypothetical protein [Vibrio vulnificus]
MSSKFKLSLSYVLAMFSLSVFAGDNPKILSVVKVSGTDAMFNYDIFTSLGEPADIKEIDKIRPELNVRFCNVVRAWKLEMARGRILSSEGKQVGAFSVTKWDCNQ